MTPRRARDGLPIPRLGPSNDTFDTAHIEMWLGECLADNPHRADIEMVWAAWDETVIDCALDDIERLKKAPRRPRSPIEQMVDRACGIDWDT